MYVEQVGSRCGAEMPHYQVKLICSSVHKPQCTTALGRTLPELWPSLGSKPAPPRPALCSSHTAQASHIRLGSGATARTFQILGSLSLPRSKARPTHSPSLTLVVPGAAGGQGTLSPAQPGTQEAHCFSAFQKAQVHPITHFPEDQGHTTLGCPPRPVSPSRGRCLQWAETAHNTREGVVGRAGSRELHGRNLHILGTGLLRQLCARASCNWRGARSGHHPAPAPSP